MLGPSAVAVMTTERTIAFMDQRSPGHHADAGSFAEILGRSQAEQSKPPANASIASVRHCKRPKLQASDHECAPRHPRRGVAPGTSRLTWRRAPHFQKRPGGVDVLAECESQQARAQQHQASCGQCEEAVGDKIVVAHDTPATAATADARPNLLKLS